MTGRYTNVKIQGILSAVPTNELDNMAFIENLESKRVKKQILLTGIEKRRACVNGQMADDLCTVAGEELLNRLGWEKESIGVLVFVTQSPVLARPSTAFLIQQRLGLGTDCMVFDVNLGCSGYTAGLQIVAGLLQGTGGRGLLLAGESHALEGGSQMDSSSLLVGDAGTATAVEIVEGNEMLFRQQSDGKGAPFIYKAFGRPGYMDGNGVLLFTLNEVVKSITEFKEMFQVKEESIDFYILHQAQKMILDGVAKGCGLDRGKVLESCRLYGNTSSASIPLTLCASKDQTGQKEKIRAYMCGFGIGLSWGSVLTELETAGIYPVMESDKVFLDKEAYS